MTNDDIHKLIFPDRRHAADFDYPFDQWIEIAQFALDRFEAFLDVPIEHEEFQESLFGNGFCVGISSPAPALGAFNITWKGIFGAGWLEDSDTQNSNLYISATLFLYSNTNKLVTKSNKSLLEYEYVRLDDKTINWRPFTENAWMTDEFDEYEFFDDPDERFG